LHLDALRPEQHPHPVNQVGLVANERLHASTAVDQHLRAIPECASAVAGQGMQRTTSRHGLDDCGRIYGSVCHLLGEHQVQGGAAGPGREEWLVLQRGA